MRWLRKPRWLYRAGALARWSGRAGFSLCFSLYLAAAYVPSGWAAGDTQAAKINTPDSKIRKAPPQARNKARNKKSATKLSSRQTRKATARPAADGPHRQSLNGDAAESKSDLTDVRARIQSLSRDLSKTEQSKVAVSNQLRATEAAIAETNQRLQKLTQERQAVEQKLAELQVENKRLAEQTVAQQAQLSNLLNRQFLGGESDALRLLLSGQDPNQMARDQYFLTQLSRAKADLVHTLQTTAREQQRVLQAVSQQQARLDDIARQQKVSRDQLVVQQQQRAAMVAQLAERIRGQRSEIADLKRDEQRLSNLIATLAAAARKAAAQKAADKAAAAKKEAAVAKNEAAINRENSRENSRKVGAGDTAAPAPPRPAVKSYEPGVVGGAFSALRGKLRMPVTGEVIGRFGSARAESGVAWKGLFIRAANGASVRAVSEGRVVFADGLRGFGNLLIIDHGDNFLSVYGNNESLLVGVGVAVSAGQPVATVGNSGGYPEPGLYFELRHRGQAFDPAKWLGRG